MNTSPTQHSISILGAGSFGTSLAIAFARNGLPTYLWGKDPTHCEKLKVERKNQKYLPDLPFPPALQVEANLSKALAYSRDIFLVVPSHAVAGLLLEIKPHLRPDSRIILATKGLEPHTGRLLQQVVEDILGVNYPFAVLSGPTFAKELAIGMPTAITLASQNQSFVQELQARIHCSKSFRVYINDDVIGVQLGGVVKNIIAISTGISDGMGLGANARTALITRGLMEMSRLGQALNAKMETFMGMSGLGDLVLTCTDNQSRNRRFGLMLGQGQSAFNAMKEIGQVVEGYHNTREVFTLAKNNGVEMPITEQMYQVLFCGKDTREVVLHLLGRVRKREYE